MKKYSIDRLVSSIDIEYSHINAIEREWNYMYRALCHEGLRPSFYSMDSVWGGIRLRLMAVEEDRHEPIFEPKYTYRLNRTLCPLIRGGT